MSRPSNNMRLLGVLGGIVLSALTIGAAIGQTIPAGGIVPLATGAVAGKMKCDGVTTTCAADGTVTATAGGTAGINQLTGDVTAGPAAGAAAATLATVNGGPGVVGSSTAIPVLTTNAKGLVTAQTTAAVVAPAGTLTGATLAAGVTASSLTSVGTLGSLTVSGATTFSGLGGGGTLCVHASNTGVLSTAAADCGTGGGGSVSVTAGSPDIVINPTPGTGTFTVSTTSAANTQSGASYTIATTDAGKTINRTYTAGAMTDTLPAIASNAGFGAGFGTGLCANSTQQITLTVTTNTINGASSLVIPANTCIQIADLDGVQYTAWAQNYNASLLNSGTLAVARGGTGINALGTGVATALGINVGSAGALVTFNGAGGTPSSETLTNATGLPVSTGISGLGTGVATALGTAVSGSGGICLASGSACAGAGGGGVLVYSDNGVTLTAGTYYAPIGGGGIPQATEGNVDVKAAAAGTIANLQVELSADPGTGQTLAVTLRDAAADKAVTCTITGSGGGTNVACQDLTHSFNVAQNDLIDWKIVTTGTYVATPTITIHAAWGTSNVGTTSVTGTSPITVTNGTTTPAVACATCVTSAAALTANQIVTGSGGQASAALGSLGTTTTVLHGNAGGAPSFGAVAIATDVSGLGTGVATALGQNVNGSSGGIVLGTGASLTTPTLGVATATSVNKVALTAPATAATLTIADGKTLTDTSGVGAVLLKGATGGGFAAATAADIPATTLAAGTTVSLTAPRQYYVCTGTCTVTPPVPVAGYEFCVMNDDNIATVITLAALGSSARYEATARTSYGTAGTGTLVSGGAAKDQVCIVGRDATHYLTVSSVGTWTAN